MIVARAPSEPLGPSLPAGPPELLLGVEADGVVRHGWRSVPDCVGACNHFVSRVLTVPGAARILGVTYPAAKANVDKLVEAGIVGLYGDAAYARRFWAPRVVEAIGD